MIAARIAAGFFVASAVLGAVAPAEASQSPGRCASYSPLGYCVEWDVPAPGGLARGGGGGGGSADRVVCAWATIPDPSGADPSVFFDYGLAPPPGEVAVIWQALTCSDGRRANTLRWIRPVTPDVLASSIQGEIAGILAQPTINSSPPIGTASIVDVPVFVEVTNWTGDVVDSACAGGLCVTVTASPELTFTPGEPGSGTISCAGAGTRYDPDGPSVEDQASAEGACAYAFALRTGAEGRPPTWSGSASVTWTISWTASTGATGSLPAVTRTTQLPRAVREVQAVVVSGETA